MERRAIVALVVGLALLVGAPAAWWWSRPAERVGDPAALPAGVSPSPVAAGASPTPTPVPTPAGATSSPAPAAGSPPVHVRIPTIGVDATVNPVGVAADGQLEVPSDVTEVGWYRFGPTPTAPGATVLAGHVDSAAQGPGAFFGLAELDEGAEVEVRTADGRWHTYQVVARRSYPKQALPLGELFTRDGPPTLLLITCGGAFDRDAGHYLDNVVALATPRGA